MKHYFLIPVIAILSLGSSRAQNCLPNGIQFTTQGQIDSFPVHYPGCKAIEGWVEVNGPAIDNLEGLIGLTGLNAGLGIYSATNLSSLGGLDNVQTLGDLQIHSSGLSDLSSLQQVKALQSLRIGNDWENGNPSLLSLHGLHHVTAISELRIVKTSLTNLEGLEHLAYCGGIDILSNSELSSLKGLEKLDSIYYHLLVRFNPKLTSLDGLQNLRVVGGDLGIWWNPLLTSLDSMKNLVSVGQVNEAEGMNINNNALLSTCSIEGVCTHVQQKPNSSNISGNAPGCASVAEVDSICASKVSGIFEASNSLPITIHPNPNPGVFFVELPEPAPFRMSFRIIGITGQVFLEQAIQTGLKTQTIQAEGLPSGLYFLQVMSEGKVLVVEKFVKQ